MRPIQILCVVVLACVLPVSPISSSEGAIPIFRPVTITTPGKYVLTRDVTGSGSATIAVTSTSDVHIDLNGFTVERTDGGVAISAYGADRLHVRNGKLKGGGFTAYASEDIIVTGLTIFEPTGDGISLDDSTGIISHNVISGAGSSGINAMAGEMPFLEVTIVHNVISDPDWHGISLGNVYRSVVSDNQILNALYGIQFFSSAGGDVHRNTIHGSDTGIQVYGVDGAHVYRNTVRECGTAGIYLQHSDYNHIEANVLTGNGNGLHFDTNANNNVYRGNTSRGNTVSDFVDSGTGNTSHGDNYMPGQM